MKNHAAVAEPGTLKPRIGMPDADRSQVGRLLEDLLADEFVLFAKARDYHWNVTGPQFHELHAAFQAQYEAADAAVDALAERVRALGGRPTATVRSYLDRTRLQENPGTQLDARGMVGDLLAAHETLVRTLRADVEASARHGDAGTSDYLTGLMEAHEKTAWMLRAYLGG